MTDLTDETADVLTVQQTVPARPGRVFEAWTTPAQLAEWWGPAGVKCTAAEVDLRIGGHFRIANLLPDGNTLWITGTFERIEAPHLLVYSWRLEPGVGDDQATERVTVRFVARGELTDVIVKHERIPTPHMREQHQRGWIGCLDGLNRYFSAPPTQREQS